LGTNYHLPPNLSKPKLAELLAKRYPGYNWEKLYLLKGRYAQQRRLERMLSSLLPVCSLLCFCCIFPNTKVYSYLLTGTQHDYKRKKRSGLNKS